MNIRGFLLPVAFSLKKSARYVKAAAMINETQIIDLS
jgi:hypothetical protein